MRPTKRGVRLTPGMAEVFSRAWLANEVEQEVALSDDQRERLTKTMAKQAMKLAHQNGQAAQAFLEYWIESLPADHGRFEPRQGPEFAQRVRPLIPVMRDFYHGVGDEARSVLEPDQMKAMQAAVAKADRVLDRFEERMNRWGDGAAAEGGNPFDGLEEAAEARGTETATTRHSEPRRRAEDQVRWNMDQLGPKDWRQFLANARRFFQFDDEQFARGQQLLGEYQGKARALMTRDWSEQVRRNRLKYFARSSFQEQALGPWVFHLEREYDEAVGPLRAMGQAFRRKVLALATEPQWSTALAEIAKAASEHGMTAAELDSMKMAFQVPPPD